MGEPAAKPQISPTGANNGNQTVSQTSLPVFMCPTDRITQGQLARPLYGGG